jgi:hypothetical protein
MRSSRSDEVRYIPLRNSGLVASLGIAYRSSALAPAVANMISLATNL